MTVTKKIDDYLSETHGISFSDIVQSLSRIGALEGVGASARLNALESVGVAERLETLERERVANVVDYPDPPDVEVQSRSYDPALGYVDVEVTMTGPSPTTVHAFLSTSNGSAYATGTGNTGKYVKTTGMVKFMPGETRKLFRVMLGTTPMVTGNTFNVYQTGVPSGQANRSVTKLSAVLTADAAAASTVAPEAPASPPLRPWQFADIPPDFTLDIANMTLADDYTAGAWLTKPHDSRTQDGNSETGWYTKVADGLISTAGGILSLSSKQLDSRVDANGNPVGSGGYPHGASCVTGVNVIESQTRYGAYEIEAKMASAAGSWPALWFCGVKGGPAAGDLRVAWPPEFDLFEGFNYLAGATPDSSISCHIHQGPPGWRVYYLGMGLNGVNSPVTGLTTEYHTYGVEFAHGWIYVYMDRAEVWRGVNPFKNVLRWFPLMNVAVKKSGTYTGGDGTGTMLVRSFKMWSRG